MPLTDVQWVLGHAFLSTTQRYLNPVTEDVIAGVLAFHARQLLRVPGAHTAPGYRPESLQILFGGNQPSLELAPAGTSTGRPWAERNGH